jgi:DNA (cytosine-5)-methyltransferase 1
MQPAFVVFENVSGFKRLYNGEAYQILLDELKGLGYFCQHGILDASDFGLPQIRKRTIIIGSRTKRPEALIPGATHSIDSNLFGLKKKLTLIEAISDLPELASGEEADEYEMEPLNEYQKMMRGDQKKLTEHNASNYGVKMQKILSLIPPGGCVEDLPKELRPLDYFNNTYARLLPNQPAPTITRNFGTPSSSRCVHPFQNRALSTREGARLQGFPDSYIFSGSKISKNLQIGNSVPPVLGEVIGKIINN